MKSGQLDPESAPSSSVDVALTRVTSETPIPLESISYSLDYTDPEVQVALGGLAQALVPVTRIEGEVDKNNYKYMFPKLGETYGGYESPGVKFIDAWDPQEQRHFEILSTYLSEFGIEISDPKLPKYTLTNVVLHEAGKRSDSAHMALELIYYIRGAMTEIMARDVYGIVADILQNAEEDKFAITAIKPARKQEAIHASFYLEAAKNLAEHMTARQLRASFELFKRTYDLTGANTAQQRVQMGELALFLSETNAGRFDDNITDIGANMMRVPKSVFEVFSHLPELPDVVTPKVKAYMDLAVK